MSRWLQRLPWPPSNSTEIALLLRAQEMHNFVLAELRFANQMRPLASTCDLRALHGMCATPTAAPSCICPFISLPLQGRSGVLAALPTSSSCLRSQVSKSSLSTQQLPLQGAGHQAAASLPDGCPHVVQRN